MRARVKHLAVYFFVAVVIGFVVIWGCSLLRCEILTNTHRSDFEDAYRSNAMLREMGYFKVLACESGAAEVYYISTDKTSAHVLSFEQTNGEWVERRWSTIWSIHGSASSVIWPYWWHFIYGGL